MEAPSKTFCDLCLPITKNINNLQLQEKLEELYKLGYRKVAIEQRFEYCKDDKRSADIFPEPANLAEIRQAFEGKSFTIYHRLTIGYSDPSVVHQMNNSRNLRKFHIIAGAARTDSAMNHLYSTFPGDIVALTLDDQPRILMPGHKYYQMAKRRDMFFELQYTPAIVSSTHRKEIISKAHNFYLRGKSKNVIITSGANEKFELRGPYDVANLGLIFGMSEEQSKSAISQCSENVLVRAEGRRCGKTVMTIRNIAFGRNDEESWDSNESKEESEDEPIPKKIKTQSKDSL